MALNIAGIDPGKQGAIAVLDNEGEIVHLIDMPLVAGDLDLKEIMSILRRFRVDFAWLEQASAMPKQGVVSMFTFGMGYGMIIGILTALEIPFQIIRAQKWKQTFSLLRSPKEEALRVANNRWPHTEMLKLKKHIGRADALLIAEYGRRKMILDAVPPIKEWSYDKKN